MACACCGITSCCGPGVAMPSTLHVTISGFTGSCAVYNGVWPVTYGTIPYLTSCFASGNPTVGWFNTNFGGTGELLVFACCSATGSPLCQGFCLYGCFLAGTPAIGCFTATVPGSAQLVPQNSWDSCSCSPPSWTKAHGAPIGTESISVTV